MECWSKSLTPPLPLSPSLPLPLPNTPSLFPNPQPLTPNPCQNASCCSPTIHPPDLHPRSAGQWVGAVALD
ncbi:MAG: hypothetical protein Fur0046_17680 [Cyanobacteria bacterium J069]